MLRSKSKPIVYVFGRGRGLLAKKTTALSKLGTKRQCLPCGAKYYDLGRKPPVCSRCGASAEPKRTGGHAEEPLAAEDSTARAPPSHAVETPSSRPVGREWSREQADAIDQVGRWLKQGEPQ